jgi:hypothetical protein
MEREAASGADSVVIQATFRSNGGTASVNGVGIEIVRPIYGEGMAVAVSSLSSSNLFPSCTPRRHLPFTQQVQTQLSDYNGTATRTLVLTGR